MYRESYVANQLNYKQKGWPQYDCKISNLLSLVSPKVFSSLLAGVAKQSKQANSCNHDVKQCVRLRISRKVTSTDDW